MGGSKMSRNAASIVNRPNCGGSAKKGGLAPTVGWYLSSNPNLIGASNTQFGLKCVGNYSHPVQHVGYRATLGGI